jgi:hypothetical protein
MEFKFSKPKYLTWEQKVVVLSVTEIIKRVCGTGHKESFLIAKRACVFHVPKRYAGGKTVTRGFD